jgi:hypothetical protein
MTALYELAISSSKISDVYFLLVAKRELCRGAAREAGDGHHRPLHLIQEHATFLPSQETVAGRRTLCCRAMAVLRVDHSVARFFDVARFWFSRYQSS